MACSCGKGKSCNSEFIAPMSALWRVYDGIDSKASADIVSIAWEREEGKVFRYDLPVPKRLDPKAANEGKCDFVKIRKATVDFVNR